MRGFDLLLGYRDSRKASQRQLQRFPAVESCVLGKLDQEVIRRNVPTGGSAQAISSQKRYTSKKVGWVPRSPVSVTY